MPDLLSSIGRILSMALALSLAATAFPVSLPEAKAQNASESQSGADGQTAPDLLTEEELEVLVARIALYPDELVAVITSASIFPLQIVQAERFLEQSKTTKDLKPSDDWDGSVISLLNYPQVVKMMSDDLEWTQGLGSALTYQQKDVLIAIQTLRDKAVANNVIKSDDKITVVNEGDNVLIKSKDPEKVYVPQYEPQMLYEPTYTPAPITYYPDPYPNYYYPTAPFFAAAVTGAIWASVVDWDDWGVWSGDWDGADIDINCDHCFNDRDFDRGNLKFNDIDWRNVDRSKINFDKNQFSRIDQNAIRNEFKSNRSNNIAAKAKDIGRDRGAAIAHHPKVTATDIRKSKIDADRIRNRSGAANQRSRPAGQTAVSRRSNAATAHVGSRDVKHATRRATQPRPGAHVQHRPSRQHSVLGSPGNRHLTHMSSNRGRHSMGGGHRGGGHKFVRHGGGRRR
ncbi:DUF3300 domain-containing protein [Neorhizobium sp. DT-125]|uniref:DUF3300 domain-containing protein n=1 Tax=Neorhizobium sp. DT-125 TaxID=3396163 RepID=UPI003F1A0871